MVRITVTKSILCIVGLNFTSTVLCCTRLDNHQYCPRYTKVSLNQIFVYYCELYRMEEIWIQKHLLWSIWQKVQCEIFVRKGQPYGKKFTQKVNIMYCCHPLDPPLMTPYKQVGEWHRHGCTRSVFFKLVVDDECRHKLYPSLPWNMGTKVQITLCLLIDGIVMATLAVTSVKYYQSL